MITSIKHCMGILMTFTIFVFTGTSTFAQDYLGKVKEVRTTQAEAVGNNDGNSMGLARVMDSFVEKFDTDGKLIEKSQLSPQGDIKSITKYTYDKDGNLLNSKTYDSKDNLLSQTGLTYNDKGQVTEVLFTNIEGGSKVRTVKSYNKKGFLSKKKTYFDENEFNREQRFIYNDSNRVEAERIYETEDGKSFDEEWKYKYDAKGNKIEEALHDNAGNMLSSTIYQYNEHGNVVSETVKSDGTSTTVTYEYVYDKKGNWKRKTKKENGREKIFLSKRIEYYQN
jgi:hypothetical protein